MEVLYVCVTIKPEERERNISQCSMVLNVLPLKHPPMGNTARRGAVKLVVVVFGKCLYTTSGHPTTATSSHPLGVIEIHQTELSLDGLRFFIITLYKCVTREQEEQDTNISQCSMALNVLPVVMLGELTTNTVVRGAVKMDAVVLG